MEQLGRYEILRPVARGGMATVYLARITGEGGFERQVALKVMHPHVADQAEFVGMFLDEARLAARIRHPSVVSTLDVGRAPEGLFLVMEYVDGPSLSAVLSHLPKPRHGLPPPIAARVLMDVLEGLQAAHDLKDEHGSPLELVHRDISPHNVLVGKDGLSRITDFGVAHARSRLTTTGGAQIKGKLAYLAPEQIRGEADRRADLYAAGIVLWETLTARRLYRGQNDGETLALILRSTPPSPCEIRPNIPRALGDVVLHALRPNPDDRFQTAVQMADAIEAAMQGVGVANARTVAHFVRHLTIPPPDLSGERLGHGSRSSSVAVPNTGTAAQPIVASQRPQPSSHKGRWLASGLALAAVAAGAAWMGLRATRTAAPQAESMPATSTTPVASVPAVAPSASVVPPQPPPSTTQAPVEAVETQAADAAPEAKAEAQAAPTPPPPRVSPPTHRPQPKSPKGSATSYHPEEL